jgi:hypothetical protein
MKVYLKLMAEKDAKLASVFRAPDLRSGAASFLGLFDK